GADPGPGVEVRLPGPVQHRRALPRLPAQEGRPRRAEADPHRARRRLRGQGTAGVSQPFTIEPADQAAPRPRSRLIGELARRLTLRTLVGRMVAGVLVLLIVLISITGTATYLSLRSFLYDRLDQQVSTSAALNVGALRGVIGPQI